MTRQNHPPLQTGMTAHLSRTEWAQFAPLLDRRETYAPGRIISHRGDLLDHSLLLVDGVIGRAVPRAADGTPVIVALQFAGDFVDLHAFPLKRLDHDVIAITPAIVALINHDRLNGLLADHRDLARRLWFLTLVDAAIHRQWVMRNSAQRGFARLAHFFAEIDARLNVGRLDPDDRHPVGLTQGHIADATGLTNVHVSRMLRDLREDRCCTLTAGCLRVLDRAKLQSRGQFDPGYLYLP